MAGTKTEKSAPSSKKDSGFSEAIDLFYGNWIWRAVHALIEHPNFNSSPNWIAKTLSISVEEALDALEGLEDLGLITRGEETKLRVPQFFVPDEKQTRPYVVEKHRQISQQILNSTSPDTATGTFSFFLSVDPETLLKAVASFANDIIEIDKNKKERRSEEGLFAVTLTCNNVTPSLLDRSKR